MSDGKEVINRKCTSTFHLENETGHCPICLPINNVQTDSHDRIVSELNESLSFVMKQDTEKLETIAELRAEVDKLTRKLDAQYRRNGQLVLKLAAVERAEGDGISEVIKKLDGVKARNGREG